MNESHQWGDSQFRAFYLFSVGAWRVFRTGTRCYWAGRGTDTPHYSLPWGGSGQDWAGRWYYDGPVPPTYPPPSEDVRNAIIAHYQLTS